MKDNNEKFEEEFEFTNEGEISLGKAAKESKRNMSEFRAKNAAYLSLLWVIG